MLTKVTEFKFLGDFRVAVWFSNGTQGTHDFSALIANGGAAVAPLREPEYFRRGFLEFGALTWPNGFDVSPEWLRREMENAGELHQVAAAE